MTLIAIDELEAGMTTARSVMNQRGQILLPKDTTLNEKHIHGLRTWSVSFIDVVDGESSTISELDDSQKELVNETRERFFSQNRQNDANELLLQLKELYDIHLSSLCRNHELPAIDDDVLEPAPVEKWLTVSHLISQTTTIPTIPEIKSSLISQLNIPDASVSQTGEILSMDPGLSALVIKQSNSAWYSVSHRLNNVARAVSVVGFDDLKKFIEGFSTASSYHEGDVTCASPYSFWSHSIATAVFAQNIGKEIGYPDIEYLGLLGLLHDLGKQVLFCQIPAQYLQICRYAWTQRVPTMKIERKYLGFYHNLLTMELLKQWNFSKSFQDIVYFHHSPENATHKTEANMIHLADAFANAMGYSVQKLAVLPTVDVQSMKEIRLKETHFPAIVARAEQEILTIRRNFKIH